jgi:hypothetical protein
MSDRHIRHIELSYKEMKSAIGFMINELSAQGISLWPLISFGDLDGVPPEEIGYLYDILVQQVDALGVNDHDQVQSELVLPDHIFEAITSEVQDFERRSWLPVALISALFMLLISSLDRFRD